MFWISIVGGLRVLTYWETYIAGLEYLLIYMVPMRISGLIIDRGSRAAVGIGCLSLFLLPVLQVVALVVFVLTMSTIILGISEDAVWAFPFQIMGDNPVGFLKVIGILFVGAIILAVIPIFGQLQSLQTLLLGGVALVSVLGIIESAYPGSVSSRVHLWPGFWFVAGLLIIGAIAAWFGMLVAAGVSAALQNATQALAQVMIFPLAAVFGFIPLFMYGAWLGAQLRGG